MARLGTMYVSRVEDLQPLPGASTEGSHVDTVLDLLNRTIIHFGHTRKAVFTLAEVMRTLVALRALFHRLGQSELDLLTAEQRQNYDTCVSQAAEYVVRVQGVAVRAASSYRSDSRDGAWVEGSTIRLARWA
jgi:hypothetical protein